MESGAARHTPNASRIQTELMPYNDRRGVCSASPPMMRYTILLLILVVGCGGEQRTATEVQPPQAAPGAARTTDLTATLVIEGEPHVVPVDEYASPANFPIPFTTSVPEGMAAVPAALPQGEAVRFVAAHEGRRNEEASLDFVVLPPGTSSAEAAAAGRSTVERAGGRITPIDDYTWASEQFSFSGQRSGFVAIGEREGRIFMFQLSYPPEYGDGFTPRVRALLDTWCWEDGSPLRKVRDDVTL
jgi:hypothetical protein